jgi:hypothetical protein
VYTSSILVVASNNFKHLEASPKVIATGLPPSMVAISAGKFLFRTPNLGEGRLHDLSGARVRVGEHVGVDVQRDCGGGVPDPAADG